MLILCYRFQRDAENKIFGSLGSMKKRQCWLQWSQSFRLFRWEHFEFFHQIFGKSKPVSQGCAELCC